MSLRSSGLQELEPSLRLRPAGRGGPAWSNEDDRFAIEIDARHLRRYTPSVVVQFASGDAPSVLHIFLLRCPCPPIPRESSCPCPPAANFWQSPDRPSSPMRCSPPCSARRLTSIRAR